MLWVVREGEASRVQGYHKHINIRARTLEQTSPIRIHTIEYTGECISPSVGGVQKAARRCPAGIR